MEPLDFARFNAVTFDCYGTLIDWESGISSIVMPWIQPTRPDVSAEQVLACFAQVQAKHQHERPTLSYPEVLRRAYEDIETTFGIDRDPSHAVTFAQSVGEWPPFPDTLPSLQYLHRFYALGILSNVDKASLECTKARLGVSFAVTVTAEDVGSYKPCPAHFEEAIRRFNPLGIGVQRILHVAQSKHHDIAPANRIGLTAIWVNRRHGKQGTGAAISADAEPALTVLSLAELIDLHRQSRSTT